MQRSALLFVLALTGCPGDDPTEVTPTGGTPSNPVTGTVVTPTPTVDDRDGDGIPNDDEATYGTDPDNADSDADGLMDGLEVGLGTDTDPTTTTDPLDDDSDDDGLLDGAEDANADGAWTATLGDSTTVGTGESDPNVADTDGDLLSDGDEIAAGSSPVDTDSDNGDVDDFIEVGRFTDPLDPSDDHWVVRTHPCSGTRTEALLVEDDGDTLWTGCGDNADGLGLYTSTDAGVTWGPAVTTPIASFFADWRVHSIQRAADGLLYIGGRDTGGSTRVVSMSPTGGIAAVWSATNQLGFAFEVEHFIRTPNGEQVAESNTGGDVLHWGEGDTDPADVSDWETDSSSNQILTLTHFTGTTGAVGPGVGFYGAGSRISEPPVVFIPPTGNTANNGFSMTPVVLATGIFEYSGELYGIDVNETSILVAGVDQDSNVGVIYQSPPLPAAGSTDPWTVTDAATWTFASAATIAPGDTTWFDDICRVDDHIIAVGRYSTLQDAFGMESTDGGATWTEFMFPDGTKPVQICHGMPDGSFRFAGADGFFAIWTP